MTTNSTERPKHRGRLEFLVLVHSAGVGSGRGGGGGVVFIRRMWHDEIDDRPSKTTATMPYPINSVQL